VDEEEERLVAKLGSADAATVQFLILELSRECTALTHSSLYQNVANLSSGSLGHEGAFNY
jgi:hypothetical protein